MELNYDPGAVAIGTAIILIFAFIFGLYPKNKKQYVPSTYWAAKQYRMHLYACILTCKNHKELNDLRQCVDEYMTKRFSDSPSRWRRKHYQRILFDACNLKDIWLTENNQQEVVCQN